MSNTNNRRIISAATKYIFSLDDEEKEVVICSPRHYDQTFHKICDIVDEYVLSCKTGEVQGFVDQYGNFYDRKESLEIATNANQLNHIRPKTYPYNELFSEDLY